MKIPDLKQKIAEKVIKTAESTAYRSVGRSIPAWYYDVKVPEVLKKKGKKEFSNK